MMSERSAELHAHLESMLAHSQAEGVAGGSGIESLRERADQIRAKLAELDGQTFNGLTEDAEEQGRDTREPRVLAEVDGRGVLLSIDINPYAMRDYDAEELAEACTEAIKAARLQASARIQETFAELTPAVEDMPAAPDVAGMDIDEILRQAKEVAQRWSNQTSRP